MQWKIFSYVINSFDYNYDKLIIWYAELFDDFFIPMVLHKILIFDFLNFRLLLPAFPDHTPVLMMLGTSTLSKRWMFLEKGFCFLFFTIKVV